MRQERKLVSIFTDRIISIYRIIS